MVFDHAKSTLAVLDSHFFRGFLFVSDSGGNDSDAGGCKRDSQGFLEQIHSVGSFYSAWLKNFVIGLPIFAICAAVFQ
jgi:hypothetical protein